MKSALMRVGGCMSGLFGGVPALLGAAALLSTSAPALAGVGPTTFYTDRSSFEADGRITSVLASETFDTDSPGTDLTGLTIRGVTFEQLVSGPLLVIDGPAGIRFPLNPSSGSNVLSPGGTDASVQNDDLRLVFDPPVNAAGLDVVFDAPDGASFTNVVFYDDAGAVLFNAGTIPAPNGAPGFQFVGLVSDEANIARIDIDEFDGSPFDDNIAFDTVTYASTTRYHGPTPYLQASDAPDIFPNRILEDFEDGTLHFGITTSVGNITGPGGQSDSVDADDGVIDGSGTNGRDWFSGSGAGGVTFTFDPARFNGYPTSAGLVWTDGAGNVPVIFEAFDENGVSLGMHGPFTLGDGSNSGTTAEDRFFGVEHASGVSAIRISHQGGGIEIDHVQIGGENLACDDGVAGLVSACEAESLSIPATPGTGVFIEVFNGIGGGGPPVPALTDGVTPTGTTLSPFIDFPNPGTVVSVGNSFDSFFASTTNPPDVLSGTSATNFILKHTFLLKVTQDLDETPATPVIDIQLGVGSDDGFHLTVGNTFLGQAGDRGFTYSFFNVDFEEPGLYPVTLYYAANAIGISGLEFAWRTIGGQAIIPQSCLYLSSAECTRFVDFDGLPSGTVPTNEYAADGLIIDVLSGDIAITDAAPDDFVPVSSPFVLGDTNGNAAMTDGAVEFTFVEPGSMSPASVDIFSCFVIDAEASDTVTLTAFGADGTEIFSQTYNAGGGTQELVEIVAPGIARVLAELGGNGDAAAIDNVCYGEPVAIPVRDLIVTDIAAPTGVSVGEMFTVSYTVQNMGDTAITGTWTDQAFVSTDNIVGGDDPQGTNPVSLTLMPGETYTGMLSLTAPGTPGDIYIVVECDINDSIVEFDGEDNNAAIDDVAVGVIAPADLMVSSFGQICPPVNGIMSVVYTVENNGGGTAVGPWVDRVFLSDDETIGDADDIFIAEFIRGSDLAMGDAYTAMVDGVVPQGTIGMYRVAVVTDADNDVDEGAAGEGNNGLADTEILDIADVDQVSLFCWSEMDYAGNGNAGSWNIEPDGLSVTQTINGEPTFFISNFDLIESQFRGQFQVLNGSGDDDFIGLVFGFQGLQAEAQGGGYYLISWKRFNQSFQGFGEAGVKVMKITGANPNLWDLETVAGQSEVLYANAGNNSLGWNFGTPYDFLLTYQTDGSIRVVIRNANTQEELFNTGLISDPDPLGPGRVGFYNYSQAGVNYAGFTSAELLPPNSVPGGPYTLAADMTDVTVDGSSSADPDAPGAPDNGIAGFQWDLGNDGIGTGGDADAARTNAMETITLEQAIAKGLTTTAAVEIALEVTDADGLMDSDVATIQYLNQPPTADSMVSTYGPIGPGMSVMLEGTADDADLAIAGLGEVIAVEWDATQAMSAGDVGDGFADTANATVSYEVILAAVDAANPNRSAPGAPIFLNVADAAGAVASFEAFIDLSTPDLVAIASPLTETSGLADVDTFTFQWTVRNDGAADATATWSDRVYASADNVFDETDTPLGIFPAASTLAIGAEYTTSQEIAFPSVAGTYFIIVVPDGLGEVPELQFEGDFAATANTLTSIRQANLVVTSVIPPVTAIPGSATEFRYSIRNEGNLAASGPWTNTVVASVDNVQGNGDDVNVLTMAFNGTINPGQTVQAMELGTAPMTAGEYFAFVCADTNNDVSELNEDDNCRATVDTFVVGAPDLVIDNTNAPFSGTIGQNFSISWTTRNLDTSATAVAPWTDRVFLSSDNVLDEADTLIGEFVRSGNLGPNGTYTASANGTWPLDADDYFLFVTTDDDDVVEELTNENNNLASAGPISVMDPPLPDLEVVAVVGPTSATGGDAVTIEYTVTNTGTQPAVTTWQDAVYLSDDAALDGGDTRVRLDPINQIPLASGASYSFSRSVTLPVSFDMATAFVIVRTDENGAIEERFENNNTGVSLPIDVTPTPAPDLLAFNVNAPSMATFGEEITVDWEVENAGNENAEATWSDLVFLSDNATLEAGDRFLGSVPRDTDLADGSTYMASGTFELPLDIQTAPGQYFVLVSTDGFLGVTESDDSNNTASSLPISIDLPPLPNLTVSAVAGPMAAEPGQPVTVNYIINNNGAVDATGSWLNEIRLVGTSADRGAGQVVAVTEFSGTIPAGGDSGMQSAQFLLPDLPNEAASMLVETDVDGQILETDEADNTGESEIPTVYLRPDLVPTSIPVPPTALADETIQLMVTVENQGDGRARPFWVDAVFLSFDNLAGNDILLGIDSQTTQVLAGENYIQVINVTVPSDLQGNYWFVAQIDRDNRVREHDETNNRIVASTSTLISQPPRPDLVVESVVTPSGGIGSSAFDLTWTVRNTGAANANGFWVDRVYLSTDAVFDAGDTLLGDFASGNPLMPGEAYSSTRSMQYPSTPGEYFVIVRTDVLNTVNEGLAGGEDNNRRTSPGTFTVGTFTATANADITSAAAGTPAQISGTAFIEGTSNPAVGVNVVVRVQRSGFVRRFNATSDVNGDYMITFTPSPTEGGLYGVAAGPAHLSGLPPTDTFSLWSMTVGPQAQFVDATPNIVKQGVFQLRNQGDQAITGLVPTISGVPSGVDVMIDIDPDRGLGLAPNETVPVSYSVLATQDFANPFLVDIDFAADQPATASFDLNIRVLPAQPNLVLLPDGLTNGRLTQSLIRGNRTWLEFKVRNNGGAATPPQTVQLPAVPWITLSTSMSIPAIQPGQTRTVVLQLDPPDDLEFGLFTGSFVVSGGGFGVNVPFDFTIVSDQVGSLEVYCTDEFTYYDASGGMPPVVGAEVEIRDENTNMLVAEGLSEMDGRIRFDGLTEGFYEVRVNAEEHGNFVGTILVEGADVSEIEAFLPRQVVNYTWSVVPIDFEDQYIITIEAEFETNVPAPVVVIEPASVDLNGVPLPTQIDYTITNYGLITADNVRLEIGESDSYEVIPLVEEIGDLAGMSSVTVPVIVVPVPDRGNPCDPIIVFECHNLTCGDATYTYCGPSVIYTNMCPPASGGGGIPFGGGGFPGGGINGGGFSGGPAISYPPTQTQPIACDPCIPRCAASAIGCIPGAGCPAGLALCAGTFDGSSPGGIITSASGCVAAGVNCAVQLTPLAGQLNCICNVLRDCALCQSVGAGGSSLIPCSPGDLIGTLGGLIGGAIGRGEDGEYMIEIPVSGDLEADYYTYYYYAYLSTLFPLVEVFGDIAWIEPLDADNVVQFQDFVATWQMVTGTSTDNGERISGGERDLLSTVLPGYLTTLHLDAFVARWNRSLDYYDQGIMTEADLPAGVNPDFIDFDLVRVLIEFAAEAEMRAMDEQFESVSDAMQYAEQTLALDVTDGGDGVCATVRIQLDQQLTVTRTAFQATLEIENESNNPLESLGVTIRIRNEFGDEATSLFGIFPPELTGELTAVDGTGTLPGMAEGASSWIILPTNEAAPLEATEYLVSGTFQYAQDGTLVTVPLAPASITVLPDPSLQLKYYLETVVFADDPFTPEFEPSIPFNLGLLVKNNGAGVARDLTITSSQPEIIENDRGLLIDFEIIGTQVGTEDLSPSLTVNLGDIGPDESNTARWLMISSLQGEFVSYSASYEHVTGLGDPRLSVIESVDIFGLNHVVMDTTMTADTLPDFLTNDFPDPRDLPDRVHLSDGRVEVVETEIDPFFTSDVGTLSATINAEVEPNGWNYVRIDDPFDGSYRLAGVTRSDGSPLLSPENAWQTSRIDRNSAGSPVERFIHIFDFGGDGEYTVTFDPDNDAPQALAIQSVVEHGSELGEVGLLIEPGVPSSEPREGGIVAIVYTFDEPIDAATFNELTVAVDGVDLEGDPADLSGITEMVSLRLGDTVGEVRFDPPLPTGVRYCIQLAGVADRAGNVIGGDASRVDLTALPGDATGDRRVNNTDVGGIGTLVGTDPIDPMDLFHVRSDLNTDGAITIDDVMIALAARGDDARFLVNPCFSTKNPDSDIEQEWVLDPGSFTGNPNGAGPEATPQAAEDPLADAGDDDDESSPDDAALRFAIGDDVFFYTIEEDRIAVFDASGTVEVDSALAQYGVDPTAVTPLPERGWWLAPLPPNMTREADRASFAQILARSGLYTAPVLLAEGGASRATPMPELLVRFDERFPATWAELVIESIAGAGSLLEADAFGVRNLYRVAPSVMTGEDVLHLANRFAERKDVAVAEADMLAFGKAGRELAGGDPSITLSGASTDIAVFAADATPAVLIATEASTLTGSLVGVEWLGGFRGDAARSTVSGSTSSLLAALGLSERVGARVTHTDSGIAFPSRLVAALYEAMAERGVRHVSSVSAGFPCSLDCVETNESDAISPAAEAYFDAVREADTSDAAEAVKASADRENGSSLESHSLSGFDEE